MNQDDINIGSDPYERLVNLLKAATKQFLIYYQLIIIVGATILAVVGSILYFIFNVVFKPF